MAYAVILPGRLGVSDVDVFAVLCPLLFSVFVLPVVVVAVPCGPRGFVGVPLLALSLVPWPPGEGCGVGLARLRVVRSWYFVFGVHDFGIFADFDVVTYFGRFAAFSKLRGVVLGICRQ